MEEFLAMLWIFEHAVFAAVGGLVLLVRSAKNRRVEQELERDRLRRELEREEVTILRKELASMREMLADALIDADGRERVARRERELPPRP